jgi:hypothetical protein
MKRARRKLWKRKWRRRQKRLGNEFRSSLNLSFGSLDCLSGPNKKARLDENLQQRLNAHERDLTREDAKGDHY